MLRQHDNNQYNTPHRGSLQVARWWSSPWSMGNVMPCASDDGGMGWYHNVNQIYIKAIFLRSYRIWHIWLYVIYVLFASNNHYGNQWKMANEKKFHVHFWSLFCHCCHDFPEGWNLMFVSWKGLDLKWHFIQIFFGYIWAHFERIPSLHIICNLDPYNDPRCR